MGIGNIGWTEFIVILALALIFFGPRRLPEIAATLGRGLRQFRKALNEVKSEIAQAGTESTDFTPHISPRPAERTTISGPDTAADVVKAPEPSGSFEDTEAGETETEVETETDELKEREGSAGSDGSGADTDTEAANAKAGNKDREENSAG